MSKKYNYAFLTDEARDEYDFLAREYLELLLKADRNQAGNLIQQAIQNWATVRDIYLRVFQPVQYEIGRLWQLNKISIAHEHFCTASTQFIMSQIYPYIMSTQKNGYSMVGCCVSGELHELGMRMVTDFFELEGWKTIFIGSSTPHKDICQGVLDWKADLLCISVTMNYNVNLVRELIQEVRATPKLDQCKVLVGGYPLTRDRELWKRLGADGTAVDAQQAVQKAAELVFGGEQNV